MKKYLTFWWVLFIVAILVVSGCEPSIPAGPTTTVPSTSTVPTGTTTPSNCTPQPTGSDDTSLLLNTINNCTNININKPLIINNQLKVTTDNKTITFSGNGKLQRKIKAPNYSGLSILFFEKSNNIVINNLQIEGPNPPQVFTPGYDPVCGYWRELENQHGIKFFETDNVTINGGNIWNINGDGIYIDHDSDYITINNINVSCVGRTTLTNLSSIHTRVNGGRFETAVWWIFNIELEGRKVIDYVIEKPTIGYSREKFLLANCPYGGTFSGLVVNKPTFLPKANQIYTIDSRCGSGKVNL